MSGIGALFGGAPKAAPLPPPPAPRIGDAASEAAARELRYRQTRKYGVQDTLLGTPNTAASSGGSSGTSKAAPRTLLG